MEATVLDKELARLDRELEKIYLKRDKNREQRAQLCDKACKRIDAERRQLTLF